jgi:hypothetical protein
LRTTPKQMFESLLCARVFREGAENGARGGRAPISISEFGFIGTEISSLFASFAPFA